MIQQTQWKLPASATESSRSVSAWLERQEPALQSSAMPSHWRGKTPTQPRAGNKNFSEGDAPREKVHPAHRRPGWRTPISAKAARLDGPAPATCIVDGTVRDVRLDTSEPTVLSIFEHERDRAVAAPQYAQHPQSWKKNFETSRDILRQIRDRLPEPDDAA